MVFFFNLKSWRKIVVCDFVSFGDFEDFSMDYSQRTNQLNIPRQIPVYRKALGLPRLQFVKILINI